MPDLIRPAIRHYKGEASDPSRWDHFTPRDGDVILSTPPKAGTTWTQVIVAMMLTGRDDVNLNANYFSPWLDFDIHPIADVIAGLDATDDRRCIKTHTPISGIPVWHGVPIVSVARHPIDVHFSMQSFIRGFPASEINRFYPEDDRAGFAAFLAGPEDGEGFDTPSLASVVAHANAVRAEPDLNVLELHYANMQRDPNAHIQQIADHLAVSLSAEGIQRIATATTFKAMKASAERYTPDAASGMVKDPKAFFDSGTGARWQGRLTEDDLSDYSRRMEALTAPESKAWIETGATAPLE